MGSDTDPEAFLSICLGKVDREITEQHRICIDDIVLEEVEAPEYTPAETGVNLLKNADFSNVDNAMADWIETIANWDKPAITDANRSINNGEITYDISKTGTADWNVQLKQSVALEEGETYEVTFDIKSSVARNVLTGAQGGEDVGYASYKQEDLALEADTVKHVSYQFTMDTTNIDAAFYIFMGKMPDVETPASIIKISNLSLVKLAQ